MKVRSGDSEMNLAEKQDPDFRTTAGSTAPANALDYAISDVNRHG
jgi:hypothetical protein